MIETEKQEMEGGFDLTVTHRDKKSGRITHKTPYILRMIKGADGTGKRKLFERPVGSGNLFDGQNRPCGRWLKETNADGDLTEKYDPKAKHIDFIPPKTDDQKLAASVLEKDSRIAELERELAAVKLEGEKKTKQGTKGDDKGA